MEAALTRRALLAGLATIPAPGPPAPSHAVGGLDAAARAHGRVFGSAVTLDALRNEQDLRQAALANCSYMTPELALKWAVIEPGRGRLSFSAMDELADFAEANGKRLRGHTLVWHRSVPEWAVAELASGGDWRLVSRYFASVVPRYGGLIGQWDVVNEPLLPGVRADGLRPSVFLQAFGPDYVERALREARTFAPNAVLMINEYGLEYGDEDGRARRGHMLRLLERLRKQGAPIQGLGLQSHLDLRKGSVDAASLRSFCAEVAALGLTLEVTELDVKEAAYTETAARRDQLVADEVRRYLGVVLQEPAVAAVSTWGLSTRHTWLEVERADYDRFPGAWRGGGGPGANRGLPFDTALRPAPMYAAILSSLQGGVDACGQKFL